ncbi:MAG: pseudouridine synthase [Nanoarchaeota archaeon]
MATQRIQKILAAAGLGARRKCEDMIARNKVRVNGRIAKLGESADPEKDHITVNNRAIPPMPPRTYLLFNKPTGYVTTMSDPHHTRTIMQLIPPDARATGIFPVGRLDKDAEGLLLLTNDGDFANQVMHPSKHTSKTYRVWLDQPFGPSHKEMLSQKIPLKEGKVKPVQIRPVSKKCVDITVDVGWNKVVKRIFKHAGFRVIRLKRIAIGKLRLLNIKPGDARAIPYEMAQRAFK